MVKVSIIGATGYVGLELTRLLAAHPEAEIVRLSSQSYAGQRMEDIYPSFKGRLSMEIAAMEPETIARQSDVVFCALPHGASPYSPTIAAG